MQNAKIVIGANYGDEGKGITTDYLAQDWAHIVVRFNGGAQAAHTVNRKDTYKISSVEKHVFGHFGSASLQDIPTYLGPRFVVNPTLFVKELHTLQDMLRSPVVFVHPECYVTTMFDMLINRIISKRNMHGTCGVGFNETITRCLNNRVMLQVKDFNHFIEEKIKRIQNFYLPARLHELGLTYSEIDDALGDMELDKMAEATVQSIEAMRRNISIRSTAVLHSFRNVVFEGAQGLLLDEKLGGFPHVTRSRTGSKNAMRIIQKVNRSAHIEAYYVTRAYNTRHGNGPLAFEGDMPSFVEDETNVPNEYQGSLRYAPLGLEDLYSRINNDFDRHLPIDASKHVVITCLDQVSDNARVVVSNRVKYYSKDMLVKAIKDGTHCSSVLTNYSKVTPAIMQSF